ncbi:MAG TPA: response regulator transcription factor [Rhodospirillaceae bacterium]|nr:response regulator transcription factor [Rhodospirillaceae bacterium]
MNDCERIRRPVTVADFRMAECAGRGLVIVIDDDEEILQALTGLIRMEGYSCEHYGSATEFLAAATQVSSRFPGPVCVLCDVRMPEVDGLALQQRLAEAGDPPLVLMSGNSGAAETVRAFRAGVIDFLLKPIEDDLLFTALEKALAVSRERQQTASKAADAADRVAQLTAREYEIIRLVSQGLINRDIAERLGIAVRTVKLHRQRAMEKLNVHGMVDLVRLNPLDQSGR